MRIHLSLNLKFKRNENIKERTREPERKKENADDRFVIVLHWFH